VGHFLRNHAPDIAAMDLLIVPTISFDLLRVANGVCGWSKRIFTLPKRGAACRSDECVHCESEKSPRLKRTAIQVSGISVAGSSRRPFVAGEYDHGMFAISHSLGMFVADMFKSRSQPEAENLFLRHQLNIALRSAPASSSTVQQ
jgi:hypothetical protein